MQLHKWLNSLSDGDSTSRMVIAASQMFMMPPDVNGLCSFVSGLCNFTNSCSLRGGYADSHAVMQASQCNDAVLVIQGSQV